MRMEFDPESKWEPTAVHCVVDTHATPSGNSLPSDGAGGASVDHDEPFQRSVAEPTATQKVALGHATDVRYRPDIPAESSSQEVPFHRRMDTPLGYFGPTATHMDALAHETDGSR